MVLPPTPSKSELILRWVQKCVNSMHMAKMGQPGRISLGQAVTQRGLAARPECVRVTEQLVVLSQSLVM